MNRQEIEAYVQSEVERRFEILACEKLTPLLKTIESFTEILENERAVVKVLIKEADSLVKSVEEDMRTREENVKILVRHSDSIVKMTNQIRKDVEALKGEMDSGDEWKLK